MRPMRNQRGVASDRLLMGLTVGLFIIGIGTLIYVFFGSSLLRMGDSQKGDKTCVRQQVTRAMEDDWLNGVLDKGEEYLVLLGYYECNEPARGDMVWFRISQPIEPVVRIVRGVPGDTFEVSQDESDKKKWYVKINGSNVESSKGKFAIESEHTPALKTYEIARQGRLRPGDFIIMSYVAPGMSDSSNLGLIRKRSLEGKVIPGK